MGATNYYQKFILRAVACVFTLLLSTLAHASPENDRIYQLETVGWLKASDNADGIFGDFLDEQYTTYFGAQSRFVVKPLKGLRDVLDQSSAKYPELIQQPEILKKIAIKFQTESLIRTRVYKEGETYRFVMEWVYAPKGDVLATVEFRYEDSGSDQGLKLGKLPDAIHKGLDDLIAKLPFIGQVNGVDGDTITISVGHSQGLSAKEFVTIYTLQSVRRHPLLNTIEEWRWEPVGRAQVEQVEESLAFAKVTELEPGKKVIRYQKIKEILPAPVDPKVEATKKEEDMPRLGWVAANFGVGSYSRDVGLTGGTTGRTGGGLMEKFEIDSQVWLNSRFIAQATLSGYAFKYNASDLSTGSSTGGSYSGAGDEFRIAAGYSLFPMKTVYDSIAWLSLGYKTTHFTLPGNDNDYTASSDFGTLFLGVGGQVALQNGFGAQLGMDLGLIRGASQDGSSFGDASASTNLSFRLAGTYRLDGGLYGRVLLMFSSQSMDFGGGQSVSEKSFTISPSLMYYF